MNDEDLPTEIRLATALRLTAAPPAPWIDRAARIPEQLEDDAADADDAAGGGGATGGTAR